MDVFKQRLEDEYEMSIILTTPSVPYRVKLRDGKYLDIDNAMNVPEAGNILYFEEPMADATIVCP